MNALVEGQGTHDTDHFEPGGDHITIPFSLNPDDQLEEEKHPRRGRKPRVRTRRHCRPHTRHR